MHMTRCTQLRQYLGLHRGVHDSPPSSLRMLGCVRWRWRGEGCSSPPPTPSSRRRGRWGSVGELDERNLAPATGRPAAAGGRCQAPGSPPPPSVPRLLRAWPFGSAIPPSNRTCFPRSRDRKPALRSPCFLFGERKMKCLRQAAKSLSAGCRYVAEEVHSWPR